MPVQDACELVVPRAGMSWRSRRSVGVEAARCRVIGGDVNVGVLGSNVVHGAGAVVATEAERALGNALDKKRVLSRVSAMAGAAGIGGGAAAKVWAGGICQSRRRERGQACPTNQPSEGG